MNKINKYVVLVKITLYKICYYSKVFRSFLNEPLIFQVTNSNINGNNNILPNNYTK